MGAAEILLKEKLITEEQYFKAVEEHRQKNKPIMAFFIENGILKEEQILSTLSKVYKLNFINLSKFPIKKEALDLLRKDFCEKHGIIPLQLVGDTHILLAVKEPLDLALQDQIRFLTKRRVQQVLASELAIYKAIEAFYSNVDSNVSLSSVTIETEVEENLEDDPELETIDDVTSDDPKQAQEAPIIRFVNQVIAEAIRKGASDIHFEPYEKRLRVRIRVDGSLLELANQPSNVAPAVASRIKIMAKLDIAEKRRPQDGRLRVRYQKNRIVDFRVSVMPTIFGEKVVLRILDKSNLQLDLSKLGMEPEDLELFRKCIYLPQGMILITGPTGSGKTTTIYSALAELNKEDVNISTAEDPVEYNIEGINQLQVNPEIGLTFAAALKTFLRQDPDIILVGEIRDFETAEIAAKAASTGHLVVSTLHTNDAPQTITRLIEMGVPPYVVTSTVVLVVAQRLVGKVCEHCRQKVDVPDQVLLDLGVDPNELSQFKGNIWQGRGCNYCNGTGIKGRIAIFELMFMSDAIKEAILKGASAQELRKIAKSEGMRTLRRSALLKLKRGQTTIQEVLNNSVKDS